ncbi:MAG: acyl-CoA dehydratase activase [Dehalococcoidales bacterium]|jgi:predicted CoA-substrate-specific enzyme activase
METYLGIDVGSVSTKIAAINGQKELLASTYLPTQGQPIEMVQRGLTEINNELPEGAIIHGVATTGSARYLAGVITGADLIKNEITCHAIAALHHVPDVQTVIEIGGQDSKIIIIRDGIVIDFGMNTVCAAGTGSFLDHQALRLNISIEEFSQRALASQNPVQIAGRCTVFAESDMVHKQQIGHQIDDILLGLCQALVRNYLSNVGIGKEIKTPVIFQGGVAYNQSIVRAFREELGTEIIVPRYPAVMGAFGAALMVHEEISHNNKASNFKGFGISQTPYHTSSFICQSCPNHCEIAQISLNSHILARWGGRCDIWENQPDKVTL